MPSDTSKAALAALKGPRERYLSAIAATAEELRGYLGTRAAPESDRSSRLASELGPFAGGRVNPDRFVAFLDEGEDLDPEVLKILDLAESVLEDACDLSERSFLVELNAGADLYSAVGLGLAWLGRPFGAAAAVGHARQGRTGVEESVLVNAFPFRRWTRAERDLAPPLVVEVEGSDVVAAGLAAYLDGNQKLILVVRGPAPPAPLVRLLSPGVLVVQTEDPDDLDGVGEFDGPVVAALMPEGEGARFVHDPLRGPGLAHRLTVDVIPDEDVIQPLGSLTVTQQLQELRQLTALKEAVEGVRVKTKASPAAGDGTSSDGKGTTAARKKLQTVQPADQLAGWLMSQADLEDL